MADTHVAGRAEQAAEGTGHMVVINVPALAATAHCSRWPLADRTGMLLGFQFRPEFISGDPVNANQPLIQTPLAQRAIKAFPTVVVIAAVPPPIAAAVARRIGTTAATKL